MREMPNIVAIVPMRHVSERVSGKNYRPFAGRPLYHWIVEALLQTRRVHRIVIDTDSPFVHEDARRHFPGVIRLERPEHLRAGTTPMDQVLLHTTECVSADLYVQTHSTNPLLRAETIDRAVDRFTEDRTTHDSLFSVTRLQTRLWNAAGEPMNHDPTVLLRTQDLPPVFEENSCLYVFDRDLLVRRNSRIGERPLLFEIPREEAVDIDEETDFRVAEILFRERLEPEKRVP